jgi:hypothetical protein
MKADINGRFGFPEKILVIGETNERKRFKYEELLRYSVTVGLKSWLFPKEVGCREFVGKSVWRMCSEIAIEG